MSRISSSPAQVLAVVPAILIGVILGPLLERYFLLALKKSDGDVTVLFSSTLGNILWVGLVTVNQKRLDLMLGNSSVMHMGYIFLAIAALAFHHRALLFREVLLSNDVAMSDLEHAYAPPYAPALDPLAVAAAAAQNQGDAFACHMLLPCNQTAIIALSFCSGRR